MSNETNTTFSFWSRLGRAFVKFLRSLLILAIIAGIVAAVYYGTPYLYNNFILPVETNTSRLGEVENTQAAEIEQLSTQVTDLKTCLTNLETRQTENAQGLAELQGQLSALETAVETNTETLKQLDAMQASLDSLTSITTEQQALFIGKNSALADLQRQVAISRAIELLSRARLYLSQSNFGLAKQDVQVAQNLLIALQDEIPVEKLPALQSVIARLEMALGNLPAFPVVAVDDVDIAWQILVNNLPEQPQETAMPEAVTETPTPAVEATLTAKP
ncbi:MAG: hypothetical protein H8E29_03430 [Anaerolineales bacterium]|uniref:Uncharacterized protein n=1 Tax=Candidatus Desulfolinea nitratireducens TaxID=2841698 RepID=A0A8J6NHT2_9CHLR|nr:hypothetical protein [Candidatus Desulfolinea nitratireducens]